MDAFKRFRIHPDFGVICWGDDLDIAPETLYAEATGSHAAAKIAEAPSQYKAPGKKRAPRST